MHWTYPGPQDLAHVTGAVTGMQMTRFSITPFRAWRDWSCPADRRAEADAALVKRRVVRRRILGQGLQTTIQTNVFNEIRWYLNFQDGDAENF
jgi:hypothetical protein